MDYAFLKMGFDGERVDHPVILSEALCNPNPCRKSKPHILFDGSIELIIKIPILIIHLVVTELMFEKYNIPSLCLGASPLFAYASRKQELGKYAMVVDIGHSSTTVVPIVDGRGSISQSAR
jgi:actin-related protein 5